MGGPDTGSGSGGLPPGAPATVARGTDARVKRGPLFKPVLKQYANKALKARVDVLAAHLARHKKYAMWKSTIAVLQGQINGVNVRIIATMDVKIYEALRARQAELLEVGEILAPPPILVTVLGEGKNKPEIKVGTTPIHAEQHAVVYAKELGITQASVATNFDGCEVCRKFLDDHPDVRHVNLERDRLEVKERVRDAKARHVAAENKLLKLSGKVDKAKETIAKLEQKLQEELEKTQGKPEPGSARRVRDKLQRAKLELAASQMEFVRAENELSNAALDRHQLGEELAQQRQLDDAQYRDAHSSSQAAADARMKRHSEHAVAAERRALAQKKVDQLRKSHGAKAEALRKAEEKAGSKPPRKSKPGAVVPDAAHGKPGGGNAAEKLRREWTELGTRLAAAEQDLDQVGRSLSALADTDGRAVSQTATGAGAAKSSPTSVPSAAAPGLVDDAVRGTSPSSRGLDLAKGTSTGVPAAGSSGRSLPGPGVARFASTAGKLAKAWKLTKWLGGVAIGLYLPLSRLDLAFELALMLFARDLERRSRDAREIAAMLAFLSSEDSIHKDRIGAIYVTGAGPRFWNGAHRRLADPQDPERITHWLERWDANRYWVGFVFARYRGDLLKQTLVVNFENEPYPSRYFTIGPTVPQFTRYGQASNNKRTVLSRRELAYDSPTNLFTAGTTPAQKNADGMPSHPDDLNRSIYLMRKVEEVQSRVVVVIPSPLLTPFDFVIFKCNTLIVEILQFISRFDPDYFPSEYPFHDTGGAVVANYLEHARFPEPVNSIKAHECLKLLYAMVSDFQGHTQVIGDARPDQMADYRLKLARKWAPANGRGGFDRQRRPLRELANHLNQLTPHEQVDAFVKNHDPDLQYIDETYLSDSADRIERDVARMIGDMLSPVDSRRLLYRYNGGMEP